MKTAVMYGAGRIGRGLVGALLAESGYEVVFVDILPELVARLNETHRYAIFYVDKEEQITVSGVRAVDGRDQAAVAAEIARAEFVCTSVKAENLPAIAPFLAAGLKQRLARGAGPLNILICENLMDSSKRMTELLSPLLSAQEMQNVGLVETTIDRIVPEQTDPNVIRTESYCHLPMDGDAFLGPVPAIAHTELVSPFHSCTERKLYMLNMAHATCAYLGTLRGVTLIPEAMAIEAIRRTVTGALAESAQALAKKYPAIASATFDYAQIIPQRFANPALADTCARVGADIPRKLSRNDRLIGAACNVLEQGGTPNHIATGIAAGLLCDLRSGGAALESAPARLCQLSGLSVEHPVCQITLQALHELAASL